MDEDIVQPQKRKKAKGVKTKNFPIHWANYQKINEEDEEEIKIKKEFFNSILIEKKPYFFKYLYKDSKTAYSKFIKQEEAYRKIKGINIYSINRDNMTKEQEYYIKSMDFRNPLIDTPCEMNKICKYIESIDFEIKHSYKENEDFDYSIYMSSSVDKDSKLYQDLKQKVKRYFKTLRDDISMGEYNSSCKYLPEEEQTIMNKYDKFKDEVTMVCSNTKILVDNLIEIFYSDCKSVDKGVLWNVFGKQIFSNLYSKSNKKIKIPKINDFGEYSYLFDKFDIVEVSLDD